jgi:hypothetical protein
MFYLYLKHSKSDEKILFLGEFIFQFVYDYFQN